MPKFYLSLSYVLAFIESHNHTAFVCVATVVYSHCI